MLSEQNNSSITKNIGTTCGYLGMKYALGLRISLESGTGKGTEGTNATLLSRLLRGFQCTRSPCGQF